MSAVAVERACDCLETDIPKNRPLCNPPNGGPAGTTQYFAKAYPGVRHLQVLKGLGERAMMFAKAARLSDTGITMTPLRHEYAAAATKPVTSSAGSVESSAPPVGRSRR